MARRQAPVGPSPSAGGSGDHRARLEALRDRLESAVGEAGHRDLAPLAGQLRQVLAELAALGDTKETSGVDDLRAARERRRAGAAGQ